MARGYNFRSDLEEDKISIYEYFILYYIKKSSFLLNTSFISLMMPSRIRANFEKATYCPDYYAF
jgi:hypothetical protein